MVAFAQSRPPPSARVWHDAVPPHRAQLFRDWLARIRFVRIFLCHNSFGFRARHDLKAWIEIDHGRSELLQDACVALNLCGSSAIWASSVFAPIIICYSLPSICAFTKSPRCFLVIMFLMDQVQGEDISVEVLAGMSECAGRNLECYRQPVQRR